jgi:hypothetical protein
MSKLDRRTRPNQGLEVEQMDEGAKASVVIALKMEAIFHFETLVSVYKT